MNKFKKFMALGLAAMMVTSLVACGGSTGNAKIRNQIHQKGQQLLSGIALPELMEICW